MRGGEAAKASSSKSQFWWSSCIFRTFGRCLFRLEGVAQSLSPRICPPETSRCLYYRPCALFSSGCVVASSEDRGSL